MPKFKLTIEADSFEEIQNIVQAKCDVTVVQHQPEQPSEPTQPTTSVPVEDDGYETVYESSTAPTQPTPTTPVEQPSESTTPAQVEQPARADAVYLGDTELDVNGMPWDERIHAASKKKNADGSWRKRRGVSDEEFEAIEQQIKQPVSMATPTQPEQAAAGGATYGQLMTELSRVVQAGKLSQADITQLSADLGVDTLASIKDDPGAIALAMNWISSKAD